jgi:cytochrome c553
MKFWSALIPSLWLIAGAVGNCRGADLMRKYIPDPQHGETLFEQCRACHGDDGEGTAEGSTPRIAGQHYTVLFRQLRDFHSGRRWNMRMELSERHALAGEQDLADVAMYVSQLPPTGAHGTGDASLATAGALLFGAKCASCHGANGRGDAKRAIPRLAGQHYGYLVRQMYDAVDRRRPTFPEVHQDKIGRLDFDQVRGMADYLSRIEPR